MPDEKTDEKPIAFAISPRHLWSVLALLIGGVVGGGGTSLVARPNVEDGLREIKAELGDIKTTLVLLTKGDADTRAALADHETRLRKLEDAARRKDP